MAGGSSKELQQAPPASSQVDELADDPDLQPQLHIASPKPKRTKSKPTASRTKSKDTTTTTLKRKPSLKSSKPSVSSTSKEQHPSSDSTLERYRYKAPRPAKGRHENNAQSLPSRKKSREKGQKGGAEKGGKRAVEGEQETKKDVKRPRKEAIVFTMPELDEDGEPIIPQVEPLADDSARPKPSPPSQPEPQPVQNSPTSPPSSHHSNSSINLPPGMQTALRGRNFSSPKPSFDRPPASDRSVTLRAQQSPSSGIAHTAEDQRQQIEECMAALETDGLGSEFEEVDQLDESEPVVSPCRRSPRRVDSPRAQVGSEQLDDSSIPPPVLPAPDEDMPDINIPPRIDPKYLDRILTGDNHLSSSQPRSDRDLFTTTSPISRSRSKPRREILDLQNRPPPDLIAALAANPSPPRPRPAMRLVPLTPAGLSSHLEALLSSHVDEAASYKARVASLEKSLAARDQKIGQLSDGLKQVKSEREALEQQLEQTASDVDALKSQVDVLKEIRRGLLGERKEHKQRIAELEMEKDARTSEQDLRPLDMQVEAEHGRPVAQEMLEAGRAEDELSPAEVHLEVEGSIEENLDKDEELQRSTEDVLMDQDGLMDVVPDSEGE